MSGTRSGRVVVAIDGVAGAGKSTTAKALARRLGYRYLDTGAMYRAVTWWLVQAGLDVHDAQSVAARCAEPNLGITTDQDAVRVTVNGGDVTEAIRGPEVTASVSAVSAVPAVRDRLVEWQRELMAGGAIVVEGRDIGTVVAPDAAVKVYLVASEQARAERRAADWAGHEVTLEDTHAGLARRDALDSGRAVSPLAQAHDAVLIDTTSRGVDQVVDAVVELVEKALLADASDAP